MNRVIGMVLVGLFISVVSAQAHCGKCGIGDAPKGEAQEMVTDKLDKMTKDLKLSAEQKAQVQSFMKEKMEKKHHIMEEKKAALDALHEEFKAKLKGVLSEEQMKKWESAQDEKGEMRGKCPHGKKGKMCPVCQMKKEKGHGKKDHK